MKIKYIMVMCAIILVCISCTSVIPIQNSMMSIEGKYISTQEYYNSVIDIHSNGEFYLSFERGHPLGLAKYCELQRGTWFAKGDTLFLNTDFQNRFDDFFHLVGERNDDSIEIKLYSQNTLSLSEEGICLDDFYYPDSNGRIVLPCSQKTNLVRYINVFTPYTNRVETDDIKCGGKYHYYIRDCHPTVFKNRKFIIMNTGILECLYSTLYIHQNEKKSQ